MPAETAEAPHDRSWQSLPLEVVELDATIEQTWDAYVLQHPHASPFHLIAWKRTIEETFSYKPVYLAVREGPALRGIVPLFYVRNPIIGRVLVSTPFAVYGGILADSDAIRRVLYERVKAIAAERECAYVEFRNAYPQQCVGEPNVSRYVSFSQPVGGDEQALLAELPKKTRNMVRKALKTDFERRIAKDPTAFERLHARNMRRLGTPNFPPRYFRRLLANFGAMSDVREVWHAGTLMAASINIFFRNDMHTYHAAADTEYNALGPNTFMYFDHLRWAGSNGFETFDFGRCKRNTGVFEFKKHWNTSMRELPYEIVLVKRKTLPNFSPANPKFDLPIRLWRKLPMAVTRTASRIVFPLFP